MTEHVVDRLYNAMDEKKTPLCVGLDPNLALFPNPLLAEVAEEFGIMVRDYDPQQGYNAAAEAIRRFNYELILAVADLVPIVKPQSAYYEQYGSAGIAALEDTIKFAQEQGLMVDLDAKRNDIGRTSTAYAEAHLGQVLLPNGRYARSPDDADMMTVNGYLGSDGIKPFVQVCNRDGKGIFVLAKTSNKSSGELQDQRIQGEPLNTDELDGDLTRVLFEAGEEAYLTMARLIHDWGSESIGEQGYSNVGAVVGATFPEEAARLRALLPSTLFLMPGYGTQGAKAEMLTNGFDANGRGAKVNSSSGIDYAFSGNDGKMKEFMNKYPHLIDPHRFAEAARQATIDGIIEINDALKAADKLPEKWAA